MGWVAKESLASVASGLIRVCVKVWYAPGGTQTVMFPVLVLTDWVSDQVVDVGVYPVVWVCKIFFVCGVGGSRLGCRRFLTGRRNRKESKRKKRGGIAGASSIGCCGMSSVLVVYWLCTIIEFYVLNKERVKIYGGIRGGGNLLQCLGYKSF